LGVTLYFAYGANMHRPTMRRRCPGAQPLGPARLVGWRFLIFRDGYASVTARPGATVHGVLWRLAPREVAVLNAYESLESGLYVMRWLPVRAAEGTRPALIYVGRRSTPGRPRPGYLEIILQAARDWGFPPAYREELGRWSVAGGWGGAHAPDPGEVA
jgi:cation transport regulator ChaC